METAEVFQVIHFTSFAGVNGAGKPSLYNSALANSESLGDRVNLDEIVRKSGDWRDERLQLDAGKYAVRLVRKYLKDGTSFHQEATLAGKSILHTICEAKSLGLEHTLNNLGVTKENLQAAESSIRDVDMAKEMMAFTKNNILAQASQAMLAQANQLPQKVLALLR